jgi:hypothetical protein
MSGREGTLHWEMSSMKVGHGELDAIDSHPNEMTEEHRDAESVDLKKMRRMSRGKAVFWQNSPTLIYAKWCCNGQKLVAGNILSW